MEQKETNTITGTIKKFLETKNFGNYTSREVIIQTVGEYPQTIAVQFGGKTLDILDNYKLGDNVTVSINIRGKEWVSPKDGSTKYFNTLVGWKIQSNNTTGNQQPIHEMSDDLGF